MTAQQTQSPAETQAPKRAEEQRAQRRRRADTTHEGYMRLGVNEALLDRKKFAYRWINDTNGRIDAMTKRDDWDIVTDPNIKEDSKSEGAQVRQLVGAKQDGSPLFAYLCRKPIEYHKEDRAKKQKPLDEQDAQLKKGIVNSRDALSASDPNAYVPKDGISFSEEAGARKGPPQSYEP